MASFTYNLARQKILDGTLSLSADTLKFMLVNSSYTPDKDHTNVGQVNPGELSGTGYVGAFGGSGRKTVASKTFGVNNTTDKGYMDCADPLWTAINAGTIAGIVVIKEITNDAGSLPIAFIDVGDLATNGSDYTYLVDAAGLLTLT